VGGETGRPPCLTAPKGGVSRRAKKFSGVREGRLREVQGEGVMDLGLGGTRVRGKDTRGTTKMPSKNPRCRSNRGRTKKGGLQSQLGRGLTGRSETNKKVTGGEWE